MSRWGRIQAASAARCGEAMRQAAGAPCRRRLWYASTAAVLLMFVHRLSRGSVPVTGRDTVSESSVPGGDTPRCSGLSIVCLADSPPAEAARSPEEAVQSLCSRRRHVVLAGHSRLRQVFEQLQPLLGAPLRTRADLPPPAADTEGPGGPALPDNSTCLAAVLKPNNKYACSRAADCGGLLLDFRWRSQTEPLSELLERLAARPPDWLVMAHGLYQATTSGSLLRLRSQLPALAARLRRLRQLGTRTAAMLEAGTSAHSAIDRMRSDDSVLVANGLLSELLVASGTPLWSAHLAPVEHWVLTDCRRPPSHDNAPCHPSHMHASETVNLQLARQIISAVTAEG